MGIARWMLSANDQLMKAADYQPLILSYRNGAAIKLADVAKVTDSVQTLRSLGIANGKKAALLIIFASQERTSSTQSMALRQHCRNCKPASIDRYS